MLSRRHAAALGFSTLLAFGPGIAAPSAWTLSKVTFLGNSQVPTDELQSALPIQRFYQLYRSGVQI